MIQEKVLKTMRKIYRIAVRPEYTGYPWPREDEWETTNSLLTDLFSKE